MTTNRPSMRTTCWWVIAAIDDDITWQDEKLQEQLRASVAALRAA